MNTSSSDQPASDGHWGPSEIASIVNLGLTFFVVLINLHQSYSHRHFHSECMGTSCCSVNSDQTPLDGARPAVVLSP